MGDQHGQHQQIQDRAGRVRSEVPGAPEGLYDRAAEEALSGQQRICRANYGKVSPYDCEHIRTHAVDIGVVGKEKAQSWADTNLGVDCAGFAGAYCDWLGLICMNCYSGGMSCPSFVHKAKLNNRNNDGGPPIWKLDDVQIDDYTVWINEGGKET